MAVLKLSLADLPAYLEARSKRLQTADFTAPLKVARQLLVSATKMNFALGQSPDGIPWAPLKKPRQRKRDKSKKRKDRSADLPLRDTGLLMASVTGSGAGSIDEISGNTLRWGTSVFYAPFHQFGTRHIPRRPFMGMTPELKARIDSVLKKFIAKLISGST